MWNEPPSARGPSAPRVLVVVEDDDLRHLLGEILAQEGFEILLTATPQAAELQLQLRDVALVLADIDQAPAAAASAWKRLEALRRAAAPASVGILTASPLDQHEAVARGYAFVLRKPCSLSELLGAVGAHTIGTVSAAHATAIHAYFDALSRQDWQGLVRLCSAEVVYDVPGTDRELSRTVRGRAALRTYASEAFVDFTAARFQVDALVPLPHAIAARYSAWWRPARALVPTASADEAAATAQIAGSVWFEFAADGISGIGIRLDLEQLWQAAR